MKSSAVVNYNNQLFKEKGIIYADPSVFKIFSFKLINGDTNDALNAPDKIVLTQSSAKKYFSTDDPIGKTIKIGNKNFIVSAVAANVPSNSQVQFDFILPFSVLEQAKKEVWFSANYTTYLLLKDKEQVSALQKLVSAYMIPVSRDELKMGGSQYLTYHLEPLTSVHLHSNLPNGLEPNGSIMYIYIMLIVAVLILIIACVNYVNLSIAQSASRGAEIGIRKVMGAAKNQLFRQFIGESMFVTAIAVIIALVLAVVLLPTFNEVSGKNLQSSALLDPVILISPYWVRNCYRLFIGGIPGF